MKTYSGQTLVGEAAAHAAWLLVQHADQTPEFQKKCLAMMTAMPAGQVAAADIAYLTDRVLVNSGEEQLYGTQLDDQFQPKPIREPDQVDARRKEIGLGSLAEYIERTRQAYSKSDK